MRSWILPFLLLAALPAAADDVKLRNGRTITGIAQNQGDRVLVEIPIGTVGFAANEVLSIEWKRTPLHEAKERMEELRESKQAGELVALAREMDRQKFVRYKQELLRRALEAEPDHEEARKMSGYVRHEGKWVRQADLEKPAAEEKEKKSEDPLAAELKRARRLDAMERRLKSAERSVRDREEREAREREAEMRRQEEELRRRAEEEERSRDRRMLRPAPSTEDWYFAWWFLSGWGSFRCPETPSFRGGRFPAP